MRYTLRSGLLLLGTAFFAACAEAPSAPLMPEEALFQKPGSTTETRLSYQFADGFGDLIRSDGAGIYVDGECGIMGKISLQSDAVLDPDKNYRKSKSCPSARQIHLVLNGSPVPQGSYVTIHNVWGVNVVGTTARTRMALTTAESATGCGSIRFGFNADGTTNTTGNTGVQVTMVDSSPNTWVVETDANSVAECWTSAGISEIGALPFRLTLTQLP